MPRGPGPGGRHEDMRPWTAAQDEVLRELVSKQGRRPKWKEITEALRNDGNYRTVAMVRNRYLRIEKGKELTELGLSKNRCSLCGQIKRGHVCPGVVEGWREKAPQEHSDAAAGSSSSPSAGSYEHELVSMYVARLLEATDLTTMTLKGIRARLADDLQAEAGKHYDKTWLQDEVKRLLSLRQGGAPPSDAARNERDEESAASLSASAAAPTSAEQVEHAIATATSFKWTKAIRKRLKQASGGTLHRQRLRKQVLEDHAAHVRQLGGTRLHTNEAHDALKKFFRQQLQSAQAAGKLAMEGNFVRVLSSKTPSGGSTQ